MYDYHTTITNSPILHAYHFSRGVPTASRIISLVPTRWNRSIFHPTAIHTGS